MRANVGSQVDVGDRLAVLGADLTKDEGWTEAIDGCDYVLHVASPFPPAQPKDPDELIVPARDGTLRVLRESLAAGVKRVVVTSSVAAVRNAGPGANTSGRELTEADWSDPDNLDLTPYTRSKTIAELAAWEYMRAQGQEERLVTVQPGAIIGPVLGDDRSYSLQAVERMLTGRMPGLPRLGFSFIDVRDVASLEVGAMTAPDAAGQRLLAAGSFLWLSEVAAILRDRLGADARKVPRRRRAERGRARPGALRSRGPLGCRGAGTEDDLLARERQAARRMGSATGRGDNRRLRSEPAGATQACGGSEPGVGKLFQRPCGGPQWGHAVSGRVEIPAASRTSLRRQSESRGPLEPRSPNVEISPLQYPTLGLTVDAVGVQKAQGRARSKRALPTTAHPSRGGVAKPGTSQRPPSCQRSEQRCHTVSPGSRRMRSGPHWSPPSPVCPHSSRRSPRAPPPHRSPPGCPPTAPASKSATSRPAPPSSTWP